MSISDHLWLRRNECMRLLDRSVRQPVNEIRVSAAEGVTHAVRKTELCKRLEREGKMFVTEAVFKSGGRADILVLDDFRVIEIAVSESEASLARKAKTYPAGLKIEVVRIK